MLTPPHHLPALGDHPPRRLGQGFVHPLVDPIFGASLQIGINAVVKRCFKLFDRTTGKMNGITDAFHHAMQKAIIGFEPDGRCVSTVGFHGIIPNDSSMMRTDFTAPLSVSGLGWGLWKTFGRPPRRTTTIDPFFSSMLPPSALKRLSMSLQRMSGRTGRSKICSSVLRCFVDSTRVAPFGEQVISEVKHRVNLFLDPCFPCPDACLPVSCLPLRDANGSIVSKSDIVKGATRCA